MLLVQREFKLLVMLEEVIMMFFNVLGVMI
jgi:hypothetical protein